MTCHCNWTTLYPSNMATLGLTYGERSQPLRISTNPDCPEHGTSTEGNTA